MRYLIAILFLAANANAASWYVDPLAVGTGSGASWVNAWTSFSAISWGSVHAGDTVYLSGGTTSQTYTSTLAIGASGASNASRVTVKVGQDFGHNGLVVIDGNYIDASSRSYVTISGNYNGSPHLRLINFFSLSERTDGNPIFAPAAIGLTVEYVSFENVNQCVSCVGASGILVQNCVGTHIRGDAAVRAVNCFGDWDSNIVQNNSFTLSRSTTGATAGFGPDGVQGSYGLTVRNNVFTIQNVSYQTSGQHTDYTQIIGNKIKIYGNEFLNVGDSCNDFDWWVNPNPADIWIYNNVYRITGTFDPFPEYIRFYASAGQSYATVTNFKVMNNTFVDDSTWGAATVQWGASGNPTVSGMEWVNNIWVNCGGYAIPNNPSLGASSFGFRNNTYSSSTTMSYRGATFTADSWKSVEPTRLIGTPTFYSYTPYAASNDFHLASVDIIAKGKGVDLSDYFTTDKDGVTRTAPWDIGAYAFVSGVPTPPGTPTLLAGLSWPATNGTIAAPFTHDLGYVTQSTETINPADGGMASYTFTNAAGVYAVKVSVNAPGDSANSLFIDFNTEPTAIWDIVNFTSGFADRYAAWRGLGTFDHPQYSPKSWTLPAGTNTLVIVGREAGVQFRQVTVELYPTPPTPPTSTGDMRTRIIRAGRIKTR